jgi:hypothetical protein
MRLLGRRRGETATDEEQPQSTACEHLVLIPMWDSVDDIGRQDRVSRERCEACSTVFSADEAASLRATEAARVQRKVAS